MFNATKNDTESSVEQIAWDKKNRRYTLVTLSVAGLFMAAAVGVMLWAIGHYVLPHVDVVGSGTSRDSAEFQNAQTEGGKAIGVIFIVFLVTLILYWPLRLFGRYMDFRVGPRPPKGGWKTYSYKPINMTLEKISDTEQVAVVDKYKFKITTRLDRHVFSDDTLHVEISEVNNDSVNFVTGHLNLPVADFTEEWIANIISKVLEDYTDHFDEYIYSI